ncbi:MAG: DinB family protein [Gemmatimonadales bacterium]|nr:DinB family protein [Gemmatimonadales bacterium]
MKPRILAFTALLTLASSAHAQQAITDPLSDFLRRSYTALSKDLVAVVATMPEQDFGFRPAGAGKEVRTFGEIVSHLVLVNAFVCAMGSGKPDSNISAASASAADKPRLVTLLDETNARCTEYLATLTDTMLPQTITSGPASRQLQSTRGTSAMFAIAHSNEHYGNLVTYLRANGLVPPAAPAQASFLSPVAPPKP